MIKILKTTPITFHGVDCHEFLLEDDSIDNCTCCDLCVYNPWVPDFNTPVSCDLVHGCTSSQFSYFQILPL